MASRDSGPLVFDTPYRKFVEPGGRKVDARRFRVDLSKVPDWAVEKPDIAYEIIAWRRKYAAAYLGPAPRGDMASLMWERGQTELDQEFDLWLEQFDDEPEELLDGQFGDSERAIMRMMVDGWIMPLMLAETRAKHREDY